MLQSITGQRSERYRIVRLIKRGGTSELFEAIQESGGVLERRVAIKRVLPTDASSPPASLLDEARIVGHLQHANIVSLIDYGVAEGLPFLVLDYVDGANLSEHVALAAKAKQKIPPAIAIHIATEISHALAYAHEAHDREGQPLGIVHRDVNPNNILISWTGDVRLTDFGIAMTDRGRAQATAIGMAKGTMSYMAPEQLTGGIVDVRTDLFGLGCVLHYLFNGSSPVKLFDPRTNQVVVSIDPDLPPEVAAIVQRSTASKKTDRYRDAKTMATECGKALMKRSAGDGRTLLVDWLRSLRPKSPAAPIPRIRSLFDDRAFRDVIDEPVLERYDSSPTRSQIAFPDITAPNAVVSRSMTSGKTATTIPKPDASEDVTSFSPRNEFIDQHVPEISVDDDIPTALHPVSLAESIADPLVGTALHGFRLLELVRVEPGARIYRAEHEYLSYSCAIKVVDRSDAWVVFEARVLARIRHPHFVTVFDCGVTGTGATFVAMELLEGRSLREALDQGPRFPPAVVRKIARQIASALEEMHRQDLVHRDLRPSDIVLLDEKTDPRVKIRGIGGAATTDGPISLLSTEQLTEWAVDPRSDLYSLGVIMYEMLAGASVSSDATLVLPQGGGLDRIIRSLLEKDPEKRPSSAAALIRELDSL